MKKIALAVVIAVVAASPALAAKKKKAPATPPTAWELNEPGRRFMMNAFPIYLPGFAIPFYLAAKNNPPK
ncbi:MAG: hypothetical protein EXQ83_14625 [Xanthobacteraceae bacterium]|nr:hypothetical protein [Xanthobacteraceae bacterium]